MAWRVGGLDNFGFVPEDYNNYLHIRRIDEMKSGDTGGLLEYLQRMQFEDLNFWKLGFMWNIRACLDPQYKNYGLIAFTLTYLSVEQK